MLDGKVEHQIVIKAALFSVCVHYNWELTNTVVAESKSSTPHISGLHWTRS